MRNFKILLVFVAFSFFIACGGGNQKTETTSETPATSANKTPAADATSYDPKRGEGKFDETNVITFLDHELHYQPRPNDR